MFAWIPYAFVRFVLFFAAGILTGIWFPDLLTLHQLIVITLSTTALFFVIVFTKRFNPGYPALIALYAAGWLNVIIKTEALQQHHLKHIQSRITGYQAVITSSAEEKENTWKYTAEVKFINDSTGWKIISGKILLYLRKASFPTPFRYGDQLIIEGMPQELKPPMNPGEFNYKRFLGFRNIYHQQFVNDSASVVRAGSQPPSLIYAAACRIREAAKEILNRHLPEVRQRAVACALLLGVNDALDEELTHAYSAAGAMHVLAVSGLHVGIIYGLLLLFFRPFSSTQKGKWALAMVSIMVLWLYAVITGLSPSVLRAVTMFSFVALAKPLRHRTNIYNTLAASAFVLLACNPFLIMSVGFQLSYMAVLGIVYLYPVLYHSWDVHNWLGDKIWQITCVSLAAQAGTFVLGLLYFHQFPTYFLISNLFVIPGATLILISGLLLFISSGIPVIEMLFGHILRMLIEALNFVVTAVEALPLALIEPVYITTLQSWMILVMVTGMVLFFHRKKTRWLIASCIGAAAFGIMQWVWFSNRVKPAFLTIYHLPGKRSVEITQGGCSYFFADSALNADAGSIRFSVRPNRLQSGVKTIQSYNLNELEKINSWLIVQHNHRRILYVLRHTNVLPSGFFDYIIIGKDAANGLNLPEGLSFRKIILDSTLQGKPLQRFEQYAQQRQWHVHAVSRQGAFHVKL